MPFKECWMQRATKEGALASTCKDCAYRHKRESKRIPEDITCWDYLGCGETCAIRDMIKAVNENTGDSFDLLGKGKKVLVLDDSKTLRNLVKMILEEYEYQIETASNGRDAIEKSNKWHPDLMICDINLTGSTLTGIDVLAQVKSHRKDLKVVMLSSKADKQTIDLCMEHGASAFIRKPFNNDDLVKRVSQILKSKDK